MSPGWSHWEFHRDHLPPHAFVFGGNTPRASIDRIVGSYDRVLLHKHDNYEPFILESRGREALLAFQVYGAPMIADLLYLLRDGGTESATFIGAAYGIASQLRVADCVVPTKVRALDGFCQAIGSPDWALPHADERARLTVALGAAAESYIEAPTASVPSTFFHGPESALPPDAIALEIETAAFFHIAAATGIRAAAALVISDTAAHSLRDDRLSRDQRTLAIFEALRGL